VRHLGGHRRNQSGGLPLQPPQNFVQLRRIRARLGAITTPDHETAPIHTFQNSPSHLKSWVFLQIQLFA
jgi:hypothetical protein